MGAFVIAVVGSLSGGAGASPPRARDVDRDDFDDVLRALAPRAELDLPSCRDVAFSAWEDFRPDGLVERVPALRELLASRDTPGDAARFAAQGASPAPAPAARPAAPPADEAALLDELLEARPTSPPEDASPLGAVDRRIREIVEASVDRTDHAARDRWRTRVDAELSARVREILRHPDFRRLEASWASLRRLVRGAETGEELRIRVVDVAPEDHALDAAAALLARETGDRTGLVVSDRIVAATDAGFTTLGALGRVAERLEAPVLAGWDAATSPPEALAGDPRWAELRRTAGARRLGLCAPRLLLRLPYGGGADPAERFAFEEEPDPARPETYAWGGAAFALAGVAAAAWGAERSLARAAQYAEVVGLPQHVARTGEGAVVVGPVETELPEPRIEAWRAAGLIPVTGVRGRDVARILSFRSVSGAPLFARP
jgi:type VI secretion system protein ImpC